MTRHTYMMEAQGKTARAIGQNLPISDKVAVEICAFLRGKTLEKGIMHLKRVQEKRMAVPYTRFNDNVGHRPGKIAAGRYPIKASGEFLKLLENAKANATNQGLTGELTIIHIASNTASQPHRNRSKHRGQFKRTHVEVVAAEKAQ